MSFSLVSRSAPSCSSFTPAPDVWKIVTGKGSQQQIIAEIESVRSRCGREVLDPFAIGSEHEISLLQFAVHDGKYDLVKYLLRSFQNHGIDIQEPSGHNTALHFACRVKEPAIVALLVRAGASLSAKNDRGETPLYISTCCGDVKSVSHMIQSPQFDPGYINEPLDPLGKTALHIACCRGDEAMVKYLLSTGADHFVLDTQGATPLHFAAQENKIGVLQLLIANLQADPERINAKEAIQGRTALHLACGEGLRASVQTLLRAGAGIDILDDTLMTPLHYAAERGESEIVWMLIQKGADFTLPCGDEIFLDLLGRKRGALDRFLELSNLAINTVEELHAPLSLLKTVRLHGQLVQFIAEKLYEPLPKVTKQIAKKTLFAPLVHTLDSPYFKDSLQRGIAAVCTQLSQEALELYQRELTSLEGLVRRYLSPLKASEWIDQHLNSMRSQLEMAGLELTMEGLNIYSRSTLPSTSSSESSHFNRSTGASKRSERLYFTPAPKEKQALVRETASKRQRKLQTGMEDLAPSQLFDLSNHGISFA